MAQLTIYLDKRSEALIVKAAAKEKVSLSKWAREKLVEGFLKALTIDSLWRGLS